MKEDIYNAPVVDEVAVLMVGEAGNRDIVPEQRNNVGLERVCETHRSFPTITINILEWGRWVHV